MFLVCSIELAIVWVSFHAFEKSFAEDGVWIALLAAFLALPKEPRSPFQSVAAPVKLESLPHVRLPASRFKMWCGLHDRFLVDVNGQLEAYDGSVKAATVAVSSDWPMQCSDDGRYLVYVDTRMRYVTRVDVATGVSLFLASYTVRELSGVTISFAAICERWPPMRFCASARQLPV